MRKALESLISDRSVSKDELKMYDVDDKLIIYTFCHTRISEWLFAQGLSFCSKVFSASASDPPFHL